MFGGVGGERIQRPLPATTALQKICRASWDTSEFRGLRVQRHNKTKSPINATELLRQEGQQLYC